MKPTKKICYIFVLKNMGVFIQSQNESILAGAKVAISRPVAFVSLPRGIFILHLQMQPENQIWAEECFLLNLP